MSITGEPGGPPVRPGASLGDISAGMFTAVGILAALHERQRSGKGQMIDISMLDSQVAVLENAVMRYSVTGTPPTPLGTRHPSATPFQAFPTADGHLVIALSFGAENQWELLCGVLALPELLDDRRFDTSPKRTMNHSALEPILEAAFRLRTTDEWLPELRALGIPCGPINSIPQVVNDPQVRARGMIREVTQSRAGTIAIANCPVNMSRSETGIKGPPPELGQDTLEVLRELLGLTGDDIAAMEARGIVATSGGPDIASIID